MLAHRAHVEAVFINDGAIPFDDGGNAAIVFGFQEVRRVIAHVTQPLNNHPFACQ